MVPSNADLAKQVAALKAQVAALIAAAKANGWSL